MGLEGRGLERRRLEGEPREGDRDQGSSKQHSLSACLSAAGVLALVTEAEAASSSSQHSSSETWSSSESWTTTCRPSGSRCTLQWENIGSSSTRCSAEGSRGLSGSCASNSALCEVSAPFSEEGVAEPRSVCLSTRYSRSNVPIFRVGLRTEHLGHAIRVRRH